jgi:membrane-associated PAP2 superfamily phosphatase
MREPEFWDSHLLVPLAFFGLAALTLEWFQLDLVLADRLYQWQGGRWLLNDHFITSTVLHRYGRNLLVLVGVTVLALAMAATWWPRLQPYRRGLWYVFLVMLLAPSAVNLLKSLTHVDCPWDLSRYGGAVPYVPVFSAHPDTFAPGRCFPSAHASGGFALVGFYFFSRQHAPRVQTHTLALALFVGAVYGVAQQLRGAHFLSHDLWALGVCWLIALALARVMLVNPPALAVQAGERCRPVS